MIIIFVNHFLYLFKYQFFDEHCSYVYCDSVLYLGMWNNRNTCVTPQELPTTSNMDFGDEWGDEEEDLLFCQASQVNLKHEYILSNAAENAVKSIAEYNTDS